MDAELEGDGIAANVGELPTRVNGYGIDLVFVTLTAAADDGVSCGCCEEVPKGDMLGEGYVCDCIVTLNGAEVMILLRYDIGGVEAGALLK